MIQPQQQGPRLGVTLEELRVWLDRQNVAWMIQQQATVEEHKRLAEFLRDAVKQEQRP